MSESRKKYDYNLIAGAQKGNAGARAEIIERHIRLVHKIASKFKSSRHTYEDLVQEGTLGLLYAIERFDFTRGVQFSTYAVPWIRSCIIEAITQGVCKNSNTRKVFWHGARAATAAWNELETDPSHEDIAARLGVEPGYVADVHAAMAPTIAYEDRDADLSESAETKLIRESSDREVRRAVNRLSNRERTVIMRRHLKDDGETLKETGDAIGLSRERTRQIEAVAKKKLLLELGEGRR